MTVIIPLPSSLPCLGTLVAYLFCSFSYPYIAFFKLDCVCLSSLYGSCFIDVTGMVFMDPPYGILGSTVTWDLFPGYDGFYRLLSKLPSLTTHANPVLVTTLPGDLHKTHEFYRAALACGYWGVQFCIWDKNIDLEKFSPHPSNVHKQGVIYTHENIVILRFPRQGSAGKSNCFELSIVLS